MMDGTAHDGSATLWSGGTVRVRSIRPEDEPAMLRFHQTLSDDTVFFRYAGILKLDIRVAHERLARICRVDGEHELVLVAEQNVPGESSPCIVAVARLVRLPGERAAEFALIVSDRMQGQGVGHALLTRLLEAGRGWRLDRIVAQIAPDNRSMRRVCRDLGFHFEGGVHASKDLRRVAVP
jgi:acetyltransferase